MKNKFIAIVLLLSIFFAFLFSVSAETTLDFSIIEPEEIKAGETIEIKLMIERLPDNVLPAVIILKLRFNNEKITPVKGIGTQVPFIVTSDNEWDLSLCRLIETPQDNYIECVFFCVEENPDTAVGMAFIMTAEVSYDYTASDSSEFEITYLMYMNSALEEFIVFDNEETTEPIDSSQQINESEIDKSDESVLNQESAEISTEPETSQNFKEPIETGKIIGIIIIALTISGLIVLFLYLKNNKKKNNIKNIKR